MKQPGRREHESIRNSAVFLIHCKDQKGIVAAISSFISEHGGNILHTDHHQDNTRGLFFMRVEWDLVGFDLDRSEVLQRFEEIRALYDIKVRLAYRETRPSLVILASHQQNCLLDLLHRYETGELRCEVLAIISNYPNNEKLAALYDIPFYKVPVNSKTPDQAERHILELLHQWNVDLLVLARYIPGLSGDFVAQYRKSILAVHPSFVPAISCGNPYHSAYNMGVKVIGATSYFVSGGPLEGPIIEQDFVHLSHRDCVEDFAQKGSDLERDVLSRTVRWYLDHRILAFEGKTVVFD